MKETNHDYKNCLCGNPYDGNMNGTYKSWNEFASIWKGFCGDEYEDSYHFIFRFDIHKKSKGMYELELCAMLQRKGLYVHIHIENITQEELDTTVHAWLKERKKYMDALWKEAE